MKSYGKKIADYIKHPEKIEYYLLKHKIGEIVPDKIYLSRMYKIRIGHKINWKNPQGFNEKLQWLKLNEHFDERTRLVDKYDVRCYIKDIIGEKYLIPLLGVWNSFDEIDFSALPDKFVLKCTHDSGGVVICDDKDTFDFIAAKKKLSKNMKKNFYKVGREYPYKNVKPRIIAEEYMVDESKTELKDYKLMCFNGKVKCSFVCSNRNLKDGLCVNFYDDKWKPMPFERHYPRNPVEIKKPENYTEMVELAEKLSENIKFVRIDFYEINGKVYFGEITFYPGSGFEEFEPEKYDYLLGSWIKL